MKRHIVTFAFAFAFFVAVSMRDARPGSASKDVWLKAQSRNITLIGDASEKEIRGAATRLEQFREAFLQLFSPLAINSSVPVTVIVFKDDAAYRPFKPLYQGKPADLSGYFQSSGDAAYITLAAGRRDADPYAIIFHEYVHALMSDGSRPLPTWLSEGVAEYFSTVEVTGGGEKVWLGKEVTGHARFLRERPLLPLQTLFAVDQSSPYYTEADKKNLFYAESWALTHYLMHGEGGKRRRQLHQFINDLALGKAVDESFNRAFQTGYATIERELENYISRGAYPSEQMTLNQRVAFSAEARVVALSEAEVQAYLGDLLWRIHRSVDGEAFLNRALSIDPKLAMAHFSFGTLRMRQNRYGEARSHFRQAAEADPQNYLAHYHHADAIHREQVDESRYVSEFREGSVKEMRETLGRARQLNPDFADTYKLLAFINLVLGEDLEEAVNLINRAISLAPRREDIVYTLAQIQMRRKDYDAARQIALMLAGKAVKPDVRERANSMLENIAKIEDWMAKMKAESAARGDQAPVADNPASTRPPPPGERFQGDQVRGFLTRIDCDDASITLTIRSQSRLFKLRSLQPKQLVFIRYTPEIPTSMICGQLNPARPVIVTYRGAPQSSFDGEPVGVEFVKPDGL
jgi:tetratricopeptide (TPR) repeat protein